MAVRKRLLPSNPCWGVEFPVAVKGLFRPHYVSWSEQQRIEAAAPSYLRNVIRIISETGLRIYREPTPMKKDQVDLENSVVWIPDSKRRMVLRGVWDSFATVSPGKRKSEWAMFKNPL